MISINKKQFYLFGWVTLLVFPIPTFIVLHFLEEKSFIEILDLSRFDLFPIFLGFLVGALYAGIALWLLRAKVFEGLPFRVEKIVKQMDLSVWDCIFLSFCAGVGEELLFRSGVQYYLGPIITSVLFLALHGYLSLKDWKTTLYGLIILPFILLIAYGFKYYGLWFAVTAHFIYDLILFLVITLEKEESHKEEDLFFQDFNSIDNADTSLK